MTRWQKFINEYGETLFSNGVAPMQLPKKNFDWLKKEVFKSKKTGIKKNNTLVGHIKEEYAIVEVTPDFHDFLCSQAMGHKSFDMHNKKLDILSENKPLFLENIWVNFQKKHEFNPIHDHSGLFSFVIFVKIPYDLNKEENYFSEIRKPDNRGHSFIETSKFNFVNTGPQGITTTSVPVDKSFEGKMFMFPSRQLHLVYPFYTSNDYRITVSGNIKIKV
jgi:hypothetical protein